jgi:hypothetical protein
MVSYPLVRLGQVHLERGDLTRARAAYEEALFHADAAGDAQGIVPALAGLARVVAEDTDQAWRLITRALAYGCGPAQVEALLAAGWVALAAAGPTVAHQVAEPAGLAVDWAEQAAALARTRRCRAGLAEALELGALAAGTPGGAVGSPVRGAPRRWPACGKPASCGRPSATGTASRSTPSSLPGSPVGRPGRSSGDSPHSGYGST